MSMGARRTGAIFLLAAMVVLAGSCLHAQSVPAAGSKVDLHAEIDRQAEQWLKEYDVPSVAVAYIENGKVAWTAIYGEQSPGVKATEKTLYNMASLAKPVSAEMILRLASAGKLSLDEPIAAYWVDPDVKDNPWNKLLTPRLCLSHQTGFTNWRSQTIGVLKIQWEPGTKTGYSGEGYDYVSRFAEKKTGRPFEDLVAETVFAPIAMKDTSYTTRDWYAGRVAVPRGANGEEGTDNTPTKWCSADLLRTTIGDYAKFVVSVMHNEGLTKVVVAQRATMTRNWAKPEDVKKACAVAADPSHCTVSAGMGLGWEVVKINDETILDHDGSDWGVKTMAFFLPQRGIGGVIFTNGQNGTEVIRKIVGVLYPNPVFVATL
jgi:CubicO group peptidase (beta-lactamase class C family)